MSLENSNVNYLISITKDSKLEKKEKVLDLSKYIKDKLQFAMSKWSNKEIFTITLPNKKNGILSGIVIIVIPVKRFNSPSVC